MDRRLDKRYLTEAVSAMEKRYGAEKTDAIIEDAWRRYAEIVDENADEPKKMYMHTRKRMYPAGAMNGTAADLLLFAEWLAKAPGEETRLFSLHNYFDGVEHSSRYRNCSGHLRGCSDS